MSQELWLAANGSSVSLPERKAIRRGAVLLDTKSTQFQRLTLECVVKRRRGGIAIMSYLFAAVLLFTSPGCPHEEPTCLTPTEYVEVDVRIDEYVDGVWQHRPTPSPERSLLKPTSKPW